MDRVLLLQLVSVFLVTQLLGVAVGITLIKGIASGQIAQPTVVNDNPEDPINSVALIAYILVFTGLLLLFSRYLKGGFLFRWLEITVVFSTSLIVFGAFLPSAALMFALFLTILRAALPDEVALRNITAIIAVSGVGALMGVTLGVIPVLVFLILLACYDFIAVFKTKHMVSLAKEITKRNLAFTVAMPTPRHQFELGTGDLALPLVFAVSAMKSGQALGYPLYLAMPALIMAASLAGLVLTMNYSSRHVGKALPALPPQVVLMLAAWLVGRAIGI